MNKLILLGFLAFSTSTLFGQNKEIVETKKAPIPTAPYSQGIKANGMLYVAGQIGLNPQNRKLVEGGIEPETTQIMENIKAIVEATGAKMDDIVNTTIYMKDIANFAKVNELYGQYFNGNFPARTTIGVANLPGGANIEIAVIAVLPKIRRK